MPKNATWQPFTEAQAMHKTANNKEMQHKVGRTSCVMLPSIFIKLTVNTTHPQEKDKGIKHESLTTP